MKRWIQICLAIILILSATVGLYSAKYDSMTTDEGIHVASAYLAITRGEFRFDPEHPYLFKYLTALPLFSLKLNNPPNDAQLWSKAEPTFYDSWYEARSWSDQWFFKSNNPADTMIFLMRIPAILALLGLIFSVYWIGKKWFSEIIGLLAAFLLAFNPTIIAHGHLANTDIPIALAILWVIYAGWRYLQNSNYQNAIYLGLLFGITLNVKHSAISLLPFLLLIWIISAIRRKQWWKSIADLLIVSSIGWFLIWVFYLFHSPLRITNEPLQWQMQKAVDVLKLHDFDIYNFAQHLRYFIPLDYVKGLIQTFTGVTLGRPTYIMNHIHPSGVWYYFPLLYLFKTPIFGLLLLGFGIGIFFTKSKNYLQDNRYLSITIFCLLYMLISMTNKLNLGIRHLLPIIPPLTIIMSLAGWKFYITYQDLFRTPKAKYGLLGLIVLVGIFPFIWRFPDMLGYTNFFVQPYKQSYLYFNDSNLDWGQQVKEIKSAINNYYPNEKIYANYVWNPYILDYYGIHAESFTPQNELPKDGIIIVTATQMANPDYNQFRQLTPDRTLANHTLFYKIK